MFVKIYKLGEEKEVTTFTRGTYVLGRGPTLQCNDKRVSRNHASLEVTEDKVELTSTHINPCFLKAANSKTITILAKDSTSQLNDGDAFALLPEDFWFKIKLVVKEETQNGAETNEERCKENKRFSCSDLEDAPPDKKMKIESNNDNNETSQVPGSSAEGIGADISVAEQDNYLTAESTNKEAEENDQNEQMETTNLHEETVNVNPPESTSKESEDGDGGGKNLEATDTPTEEKVDEAADQENEVSETNASRVDEALNEDNKEQEDDAPDAATSNNPSPAPPKLRREKCWYGAECYRKNPVHRQDFAHPGDSDFESDPDDNRPSCSHGATCYRKNKLHRQQYKHPPRDRPGKKKRPRKKVNRLNAADSQEMKDFFDDFPDSEDPFINDDDSDEYTGESDDDSDWEESQEPDDDDENVKRLLREANRFVKK